MKILKAKKQYLHDIIEINKVIDYGNPEEFMEKSIEEGRVLVAVNQENRVVGYLLFQVIWGNTPFIALIKILPEFQKQGLGTELLMCGEELLKELGFHYYYSSTGDDNLGSKTFHEKLGFSEIGRLEMNFGSELFYKKHI